MKIQLRNCWVFALGLLVLLMPTGCADERKLEAKRALALDQLRQTYLKSTNPVPRRWGSDILVAITNATLETLRSPKCASAVLASARSGACYLWVLWVEAVPSVTAVELRYGPADESIMLPLSEIDLRESRRAGETTIVFGSTYMWDGGSDLARRLMGVTTRRGLEVRLWQAGKPMGAWFPVWIHRRGA